MKYVRYLLALAALAVPASACAQTFTTLVQFTGDFGTAPGANPRGSLTLSGSTLYGMTQTGGAFAGGNIFSVGTNGTDFQNLVSFGGTANAQDPWGSLTLSGSTLYGMSAAGGTYSGNGNVFSVGTDGTNYQNLLSFTGTGGAATGYEPQGSLALTGTTLYGMTPQSPGPPGASFYGNAFSVGTDGTNYRNLISFIPSGTPSGRDPQGSLTPDGATLYGTTWTGGPANSGQIFSVGTDGTNYRALFSFSVTANGANPVGSLTLSGTTLYGMTETGTEDRQRSLYTYGTIFSVGADGTNYRTLVSFTGTGGSFIGDGPYGSLVLSGTTLYGMTSGNGDGADPNIHGYGNVFSVGIDGSDYQNLYSFTGGADGGNPYGDLTLSGGTLFGMTEHGGGPGDNGTIFALVVPEPGTLSLAGAALLAVGWRLIRRRRRALFRPTPD